MFTKAQRRHLRGVSLSRIICDNSHITRVPSDPFSRTEKAEDMLPCSHPLISHLDLWPWKEPDTGEEGQEDEVCCVFSCLCLNLPELALRSRMWSDTQDSIWILAAL